MSKAHKHDILFFHCKYCLGGKLEISISDKGMVGVCAKCGKIIFNIEKDKFKEFIETRMAVGCSICQAERLKN